MVGAAAHRGIATTAGLPGNPRHPRHQWHIACRSGLATLDNAVKGGDARESWRVIYTDCLFTSGGLGDARLATGRVQQAISTTSVDERKCDQV